MRHTLAGGLLATVLLALVGVGEAMPAFAEPIAVDYGGAQKSAAAARQRLLGEIASLNEDLVEFALDGNVAQMAETAGAVEASLPKLRAVLSAPAFADVEARSLEQRSAVRSSEGLAAALASVELYRLLQEAMDPRLRIVPLQISLLDYAGFKLLVLTRSDHVDWALLDRGVKEANTFWNQVERRVRSTALRELAGSVVTGLAEASRAKNRGSITFAATVLLGLVDVLEGHFLPK